VIFKYQGNLFDVIVAGVPTIKHLIIGGGRANDLSISRNIYHSRCLSSLCPVAADLRTLAKKQLDGGARLPHIGNARLTLTVLITALSKGAADEAKVIFGLDLLKNLEAVVLLRSGIGFTDSKYSVRVLRGIAPTFINRYTAAARALCGEADAAPLLALANRILGELGGPLLDGFRYDYPAPRISSNPPTAAH